MAEQSEIDREIRQQAAALRGAGMEVGDDDHGQMLYDAAERIESLWNGGNEMTDRYLKACEERNEALGKLDQLMASHLGVENLLKTAERERDDAQSRLHEAELTAQQYAKLDDASHERAERLEIERDEALRRLDILSTALAAIRGLANDFSGTADESAALAQIKNIAGSDLVVEKQCP